MQPGACPGRRDHSFKAVVETSLPRVSVSRTRRRKYSGATYTSSKAEEGREYQYYTMPSHALRVLTFVVLVSCISAVRLSSGFSSAPSRLRGGGPDEDSRSPLRRSSSQEAINQFQRELRGGEPVIAEPIAKEPEPAPVKAEPTVVQSIFSVFESKAKSVAPADTAAPKPVAADPSATGPADPLPSNGPAATESAPPVAKPVPAEAKPIAATVSQGSGSPTTASAETDAAASVGTEPPVSTPIATAVPAASAAPASSAVPAVAAVPAVPAVPEVPKTAAESIAAGRPAVMTHAMGLGQPSPKPQLDIEEARLLVDTDKFLEEVRSEPIGTGDPAFVQTVVKKNRLFLMRCKSVLENTVDNFTRKQVELRISNLESAYDDASTICPSRTKESLIARSPSQPFTSIDSDEEDYDAANPAKYVCHPVCHPVCQCTLSCVAPSISSSTEAPSYMRHTGALCVCVYLCPSVC